MDFYFCDKYINTDADDKDVERICMRLSHIFGVLMIVLGMRSEKMILNFFSYFILTSEQKYHYAQMKLVGQAYCGGKIAISMINIGLSYKIIFVICMLHTFFMYLRQTTMISMLSKSLSS